MSHRNAPVQVKVLSEKVTRFGKECLIKTEADHPATTNHLLARTAGSGEGSEGEA